MTTMSSSPSLNPASTPFFPGGGGQIKEDDSRGLGIGFHRHASRERFATTSSSISVSPTDYRSVKSSPSPPSQDGIDQGVEGSSDFRPAHADLSRQSPALGQQDSDRGFSFAQRRIAGESSMTMIPEVPPEGDETLGRGYTNGLYQPSSILTGVMGRARERLGTPPVAVEMNSRTASLNSLTSAQPHFISSSPASSLDSGGIFTSGFDLSTSFEAQARSSPLINELMNRMDRHEASTRDIQRELRDMTRKINLLLERSLNAPTSAVPEFSNPFAPSSSAPSFSTPDLNGFSGPRGSIVGNIAPNQAGPTDDISAISNRISSLTTSVDQLVAIQQSYGSNLSAHSLLAPSVSSNELLPRNSLVPPGTASGLLGHGMPPRPSPRIPAPPSRTWSTGQLEVPLRTSNDSPAGSLGRADGGFRDKRRSVATMLRRDSSAVRSILVFV
jgi:hypothetical protein